MLITKCWRLTCQRNKLQSPGRLERQTPATLSARNLSNPKAKYLHGTLQDPQLRAINPAERPHQLSRHRTIAFNPSDPSPSIPLPALAQLRARLLLPAGAATGTGWGKDAARPWPSIPGGGRASPGAAEHPRSSHCRGPTFPKREVFNAGAITFPSCPRPRFRSRRTSGSPSETPVNV